MQHSLFYGLKPYLLQLRGHICLKSGFTKEHSLNYIMTADSCFGSILDTTPHDPPPSPPQWANLGGQAQIRKSTDRASYTPNSFFGYFEVHNLKVCESGKLFSNSGHLKIK